ncbi:MAG: hypothetical protein U0163_21495, partial [Gemmatimonadaceae bacterium]
REALLATDAMRGARSLSSPAGVRAVDGDPDSFWAAESSATSARLELELARPARCSVVRLQEAIANGQTIERFTVEAVTPNGMQTLARGTTVGYCRLARFSATVVERVRVTLESAYGDIRLATVSLHAD